MEKTMCELFAGVGGFRVGFERSNPEWNTVWFSQWEPGAKTQWAHDCYVSHFGDCPDMQGEFHTGDDIATVNKGMIPNHTLLVGGFPCQDYSVAHSLASSHGIEGKKGVLWWQIRNTIIAKQPPFCLFENVDRLLKSPASQRGRDFGIILACLNEQGYSVEWRVINAADYGAAQRRRRTFIFAYKNTTKYGIQMGTIQPLDVVNTSGLFAREFPIEPIEDVAEGEFGTDLIEISNTFKFNFCNAGYMTNGKIFTASVKELKEQPTILEDIVVRDADESCYISQESLPKWVKLKGAKKIPRKTKDGHEYTFSEGPIAFPDPLDKPSRTMLTSESTLNRSTHVIADIETGRLRLITPIEAERLQGFPDNWTNTGMPNRMRYFCMGNALVTHMITRMAHTINTIIENED